jgi:hypothetical protein
MLSDAEKNAVWEKMRGQVPMIHVYEKRTDRKIRVFRIRRIDAADPDARTNHTKGHDPA